MSGLPHPFQFSRLGTISEADEEMEDALDMVDQPLKGNEVETTVTDAYDRDVDMEENEAAQHEHDGMADYTSATSTQVNQTLEAFAITHTEDGREGNQQGSSDASAHDGSSSFDEYLKFIRNTIKSEVELLALQPRDANTVNLRENYREACDRIERLSDAAINILGWLWTMQMETEVSDQELYWNLFPREYNLAMHFIQPEALFNLRKEVGR